jgi:hypothetical protein
MKNDGYAPPTKGPPTARIINTDHMQFLKNRRVLTLMEKSSDAAQVPFVFSGLVRVVSLLLPTLSIKIRVLNSAGKAAPY